MPTQPLADVIGFTDVDFEAGRPFRVRPIRI
jgi:hypothetical protein